MIVLSSRIVRIVVWTGSVFDIGLQRLLRAAQALPWKAAIAVLSGPSRYAEHHAADPCRWHFLGCSSQARLAGANVSRVQ